MTKRLTKEAFVEKANKIHNHKYDYSDVVYLNNRTKIRLKCFLHGPFYQKAANHLNGNGCPVCAKSDSINEFIKKAIRVHGKQYCYNDVDYKRSNVKVNIRCKEHGPFQQTPNKHLQGQGCPTCAGTQKSNTEEFITKAKRIHGGKYGYENVQYRGAYHKVTIVCPKHGRFTQDPHDHLRGKGCCQCKHPVSKAEVKWLNSLGIPKNQRSKHLTLGGDRFVVDGYCPDTNTVYEFYGDYWHGNPDKYPPQDINKHTKCSFGELYKRTIEREIKLKRNGLNIVSMWESRFTKR